MILFKRSIFLDVFLFVISLALDQHHAVHAPDGVLLAQGVGP